MLEVLGRKVQILNPHRAGMQLDLRYIAGFLDGEGSISVIKRRRNLTSGTYFLTVRIANTNKEVLDYIRETFEVGNVYLHYDHRPNHKPVYHYVADRRAGLKV